MSETKPDSFQILSIGEILVEIMRPSAGQPLEQPGDFRGPFASGATQGFGLCSGSPSERL